MKNRTSISITLITLFLAMGTYTTHAQSTASSTDIPRTISYQGKLTNTDGSPVLDGTYPITISLCANADGTGKVWQETYSTSVTGGIFSLYLGSGKNPLPDPAIMNAPLWIATQIGDAPQMSPLSPLSASPYALNVSDKAITTGKLADGAVTAEKVDMPYVSAIEINDQKVSGVGTVLKLKSSDDIALNYDEATNSVTIASKNDPASGNSRDPEKGASVQDAVFGTGNWLGRDAGAGGSFPFFQLPYGAYNTLGGGFLNTIGSGCEYSTIAGGSQNMINADADYDFIGGGSSNTTFDGGSNNVIAGGAGNAIFSVPGSTTEYGGILSGSSNTIGSGADASAIGGGISNFINTNSTNGFIGGGAGNQIWPTSSYNAVAGGNVNNIYTGSDYSAVGGGQFNSIGNAGISTADWATIAGGLGNSAEVNYSTIGGGSANKVTGTTGTIAGGEKNEVQQPYGMIGGGYLNTISGSHGFIGGGNGNNIIADYGVIGGGYENNVETIYGTIAGGELNLIRQSAFGTIGGGAEHQIISANYGTIGGGWKQRLLGDYGTIAGGSFNILNADLGFIGGGAVNQVDAQYASIAGGMENWARAEMSAIPGGDHVQTTGYAQTAMGFYNAPRGALSTQPTTAAKATINDPLLMVGNGTPATAGGPVTRSNAFEVSYNGHSVVYDLNGAGTSRRPIYGATYRDNIIYAWGDINGNGTINSDFGVVSCVRTGIGAYTISIAVNDPQTGAPVILNNASITATVTHEGVDPGLCYTISTSRIGNPGANQFTVRIKTINCLYADSPFAFKITGRP